MQSLETEAAFDAVMQAMNFAWGRKKPVTRDQVTLRARGAIIDVDDRAGGHGRSLNLLPIFQRKERGARTSPHRGEHNVAVLTIGLASMKPPGRTPRSGALLESQP